jgi:hypothetical protein
MDEHEGTVTPVPVHGEVEVRVIHGSVLVHEEAADFGAAFTITFAGTEAPEQLLNYDVNRARAYITCTGTGPVYVGYKDASGVTAMRNGQTAGQAPAFILASGITLPVTHKQAVFIAPDGTHSATVSVAVERWES